MIDGNNMSNEALIKEQYKNTDSLKLRKSLHEKYSVNKVGSVAEDKDSGIRKRTGRTVEALF